MRTLPLVLFLVVLLCVALAMPSPTVWAEEGAQPWYLRLLTPSEATSALQQELSGLSRNEQWNARPKLAGAYLDAWKAGGATAEGPEEVMALHRLNASARRFDEAVKVALPLLQDTEAGVAQRALAAQGISGYMTQEAVVEALGEEGLAELATAIETFATSEDVTEAKVDTSRLLFSLAQYYGSLDDNDKVVQLNMAGARASPGRAAQAGRSILRTFMSATTRMEDYPGIREKAKTHFDELRALAARYVETTAATGDERAMSRAAAAVKQLDGAETTLAMLGEKAPEWTLRHAFGEVKQLQDLEGKVVFVDFWATWCGWCIKSFPAVRDLLRDYADQDLAIIGVTTTAPNVAEANFNLDEDMKHKLKAGEKPTWIHLASERSPADPEKGVYDAETFPSKERETLALFIANHEMTWPVVMIDKTEPKEKYGLLGWPHAVVIDRQGRVRYFKVGALLRDREEQVKHFREVLDQLLAEDAPEGQ